MNRRSFFGLIFGALLAKFLPWHKRSLPSTPISGTLNLNFCEWQVTQAENVHFDGYVVRAIDPTKPCSFTVSYRTRNGYITTTSPAQKWAAVSQFPAGPPNVVGRVLHPVADADYIDFLQRI